MGRLEQIACESTTIRTLVVFAVLLAVAYAQFECDGCDTFPDRKSRTGCRLFCYFDFNNEGVLTRQGLVARLRNDQDTGLFILTISPNSQCPITTASSMFLCVQPRACPVSASWSWPGKGWASVTTRPPLPST